MNRNRIALGLWILLFAALGVTLAYGADIQRGITFTDGQRLTASQLHTLVDNATITTGFIVNKPGATSLESGALFVIYSPASQQLEKVSAATALYNNTALITGLGEKGAPAANDFLLIYDATGTVLAKTMVGNFWSNNIASLPSVLSSNLNLEAELPILNNGTNGVATLTNLFLLFPYTALFTNLPVRTSPTNFDNVLLCASDDNTNFFMRRVSLAGLITNLPNALTLTNTADTNGLPYSTNLTIFAFQTTYTTNGITNTAVVKFDLLSLQQFFTNYFVTTPTRPLSFKSAELMVTNTLITIDIPHGLPGTPDSFRAVLLCKTNEANYKVGDEIVLDTGVKDSSDGKYGTYGRNSTNLFLVFKVDGRIQVPDKTTGVQANLTGNSGAWVPNWRLKFYATYFPVP